MKKFISVTLLLSTLLFASSWVSSSPDILSPNTVVGLETKDVTIYVYDRKTFSIKHQDPDTIRENLRKDICELGYFTDGHYFNFVYLYNDGSLQVTIQCQ